MAWYQELLIGFDLETTGTDPREARIVTGAVIEVRDGQVDGPRGVARGSGRRDPGRRASRCTASATSGPPPRAAPPTGWRTRSPTSCAAYWRTGVPVVAYNAAFDLTLLSAELRRHGLPSLSDRLGGIDPAPVVDPYTIDRSVDRYRRGKRNLEAVCAEYGVVLERPTTPAPTPWPRSVWPRAIAARHPKVASLGPAELHAARSTGTRNGPRTSRVSCAARATGRGGDAHLADCATGATASGLQPARSGRPRARRARRERARGGPSPAARRRGSGRGRRGRGAAAQAGGGPAGPAQTAVRRDTSAPPRPRPAATPPGAGTPPAPRGSSARAEPPRRSSRSRGRPAARRSRPTPARPSRTPR